MLEHWIQTVLKLTDLHARLREEGHLESVSVNTTSKTRLEMLSQDG